MAIVKNMEDVKKRVTEWKELASKDGKLAEMEQGAEKFEKFMEEVIKRFTVMPEVFPWAGMHGCQAEWETEESYLEINFSDSISMLCSVHSEDVTVENISIEDALGRAEKFIEEET